MPTETRSPQPASNGVAAAGSSNGAMERGLFRKEGEFWTIASAGKAIRLKDTKGLGYLAHLLRHPGVEFHVLDLLGGIAGRSEEDDASPAAYGLPRGDEELEK